MSIKDTILSAGLKTETVEAFGTTVTIRQLNLESAIDFHDRLQALEGQHLLQLVEWFIECVIDPDTGERAFTKAEEGAVRKLPLHDFSKVAQAAVELNRSRDPETVAKNSEASPIAVSSTV